MIRVFVRANSDVELAGLEALVKSASFLELSGSSLGAAQPGAPSPLEADVLLERPLLEDAVEAQPLDSLPEAEEGAPPRVWIVAEAEIQAGLGAVREGSVRALLPQWASGNEIRSAIEAAAAGLVVLHPDIVEQVTFGSAGAASAGDDTSGSQAQQLSPREGEILNLLAGGLGNKQIAGRLGISDHTVKFHVTSIFNKLGASSRAEAVAIGVRRGLIIL